jgi:hypothetical protein
MSTLTLTLSPEASEIAKDLASDLNISPDEAVARIVNGFSKMFKSVVVEPSTPSVEIDQLPIEAPTEETVEVSTPKSYGVTFDGVYIEGHTTPELTVNLVKHITPKKVYAALVSAGVDTNITAIVKTSDNGNPKHHRRIVVDGFAWYIHIPTGYGNCKKKMYQLAKILKKPISFDD